MIESATVARRRKPAIKPLTPNLVAEITEALLELGGAAHRDLVIDRVALRRGSSVVSDRLRRDLIDVFESACETAEAGRRPAMLCRPFGSASHRWAISKAAVEVLQPSDPRPAA